MRRIEQENNSKYIFSQKSAHEDKKIHNNTKNIRSISTGRPSKRYNNLKAIRIVGNDENFIAHKKRDL